MADFINALAQKEYLSLSAYVGVAPHWLKNGETAADHLVDMIDWIN